MAAKSTAAHSAKTTVEQTCVQCQRPFFAQTARGRFCSKPCYARHNYLGRKARCAPSAQSLADGFDVYDYVDDGKPRLRREKLAKLFEKYDGLHHYRTAPPTKTFPVPDKWKPL